MYKKQFPTVLGLFLVVLVLALNACNSSLPSPAQSSATPAATSMVTTETSQPDQPESTAAPPTPSPTSPPLAARVNDSDLLLADYQAELERFRAAKGTDLTPDEQARVMDDLIDQVLLAQAAAQNGYVVDEATLQARVQALSNQLGGDQALENWMSSNGYTADSFRRSLARAIAAAWMRDQIINAVPETAEQVHARQILLTTPEEATSVLVQLQQGASFDNLAAEYDPLADGDLGWFPRGYLLDPQLDAAAFNLEPGAISDVIQTPAGYHILQVLERDPQRPLTKQTRLTLQEQALSDWLEAQRAQSEIDILAP